MQSIEIITKAERYRRWSDEARAQILAECEEPGAIVAQVARRHDIRTNLIYKWRKMVIEREQKARAILRLPEAAAPAFISYGEIAKLSNSAPTATTGPVADGYAEAKSSRTGLEILAPNGFRLLVHDGVSDALLNQVLRHLGAL